MVTGVEIGGYYVVWIEFILSYLPSGHVEEELVFGSATLFPHMSIDAIA